MKLYGISALKIVIIKSPLKKGPTLECDNYRPIFYIPTFSKIFEKIILTRLFYHLSSNNLLFKHEFGFRPNKSTLDVLLR